MSFSDASSTTTIYNAVPLLPQHEASPPELSEPLLTTTTTTTQEEEHVPASSCCSLSTDSWWKCLNLVSGINVGIISYYLVDLVVIPLFPSKWMTSHTHVGCVIMSLTYSTITVLCGYCLWYAVYHTVSGEDDDDDENDPETITEPNHDDDHQTFWNKMEHVYSVGIFIGFGMACLVVLISIGIPTLQFLVCGATIVVLLAILQWYGPIGRNYNNNNQKETESVLPLVV